MRYVALLRGINVGGKNMIKMADIKESLEHEGFRDIRTYIQSGNILFESDEKDPSLLATKIEEHILSTYGHTVPAVVLDDEQMKQIVNDAPDGWGEDVAWKYNTLFLIPPYDMDEATASIGTLKPDIEVLIPGAGVLYQAMDRRLFGRTTTGKLASLPAYKKMTIRNWNTTRKLLELLG